MTGEEQLEKEKNKKEMQEAGKNTAHVAGKVAATYLGGTLGNVAYDKIANTKLGQKIEQGVGKVISNRPLVGRLNKKLNDSGLVSAVGTATDLMSKNGSPNDSKLSKTTNKLANNKNLKSVSKNNRLSNNKSIPQSLENNRQKQGSLSHFQNKNNDSEEDIDTQEQDYNDFLDSDDKESIKETILKIQRLKQFLPIIAIGFGILLFIILFIYIYNNFSVAISFFSFEFQNTDKENHVYNTSQPELLQDELTYNNKLSEVVENYRTEYAISIDKYILHALVIYPYYISSSQSEEDDKKETSIDYAKAIKKIEEAASVMIVPNGEDAYTTDTEIDGVVYNNIVNSEFLTTYYKNYLIDYEEETRKKLVSEIYNFAELARELVIMNNNSGFLSDSIKVYLQTCDFPYNLTVNERGNQVYNNPNVNAGTSYPEYLSMTDYLKGVVLAELGTPYMDDTYREGVKAFVIAATTFALGSSRVDFYPGIESFGIPSGDCRQLSCDPNYGCSYNKERYSTTYTGVRNNTQRPGWKKPLTQSQQDFMNSVLEEVFGYVMVKKGITSSTFTGGNDLTGASYYDKKSNPHCGYRCLGADDALLDAKNGMSYVEILDKYYHSDTYDLISIQEGLYYSDDTNVNLNGQINLNENFHFHQGDYKISFCGRSDATISSSGCGVTSAGIVVSLLTGVKHDPVEMMNLAYANKKCGAGISGTDYSFHKIAANKYGLGFYQVSKSNTSDISKMLNDLASGKTAVVARMAKNNARYSTSSGHYITLVGVKNEGGKIKVLVWDPLWDSESKNSKRDNYWADFNDDILKYTNTPSFFVYSRR